MMEIVNEKVIMHLVSIFLMNDYASYVNHYAVLINRNPSSPLPGVHSWYSTHPKLHTSNEGSAMRVLISKHIILSAFRILDRAMAKPFSLSTNIAWE